MAISFGYEKGIRIMRLCFPHKGTPYSIQHEKCSQEFQTKTYRENGNSIDINMNLDLQFYINNREVTEEDYLTWIFNNDMSSLLDD